MGVRDCRDIVTSWESRSSGRQKNDEFEIAQVRVFQITRERRVGDRASARARILNYLDWKLIPDASAGFLYMRVNMSTQRHESYSTKRRVRDKTQGRE